jgi:hypothetical protein
MSNNGIGAGIEWEGTPSVVSPAPRRTGKGTTSFVPLARLTEPGLAAEGHASSLNPDEE